MTARPLPPDPRRAMRPAAAAQAARRSPLIATILSAVYIAVVAVLFGRIPWGALNALLTLMVLPMLWLLWRVANFFVNLHDDRYERDVEKIHGERPRPLPHQEARR